MVMIMSVVTVDRTSESTTPDTEILVTLKDGFKVRFFIPGLSDSEYKKRARAIRALEQREIQKQRRGRELCREGR
jgi:hypothetical protein